MPGRLRKEPGVRRGPELQKERILSSPEDSSKGCSWQGLGPGAPILMLDEPTASLDPNMKDCTYDILRKVNRRGALR